MKTNQKVATCFGLFAAGCFAAVLTLDVLNRPEPVDPILRLNNALDQGMVERSYYVNDCDYRDDDSYPDLFDYSYHMLRYMSKKDTPWNVVGSQAAANNVICLDVEKIPLDIGAINWSFDIASLQVCRHAYDAVHATWLDGATKVTTSPLKLMKNLTIYVKPGVVTREPLETGGHFVDFYPIHNVALRCPSMVETERLIKEHIGDRR